MKRILFVIVLLGWGGHSLHAEDTAETLDALKRQIEILQQKVAALEHVQELEVERAAADSKETPRLTVGESGVSVSSADTNFVFQLHGLLQVDSHTFFNANSDGSDSFLLRRARPIFSGTVYHDFDFLFAPDFGGLSVQIFDAYLNYKYQPWLQFRAGKFKTPVGLEYLQSDPVTPFAERSLVTALMPGRDVGFQLWGNFRDEEISYAAGVFNGLGDGRNGNSLDFEGHREFAGRVFFQPFLKSERAWKGLGFGVGGSWGNVSSNIAGLPNNSGYFTDAQRQFFAYTNGVVAAGNHWRLSPQSDFYFGPFSLLGEYALSGQSVRRGDLTGDLTHKAWQASAGWVLTGEAATFAGVIPRDPFNLAANRWGAFQIVARYATLDIDNAAFPIFADPAASATEAQSWAVGLNWYLNRDIRASASFSRTTFKGGGVGSSAPATVTRQPEEVLFTRLQLAF